MKLQRILHLLAQPTTAQVHQVEAAAVPQVGILLQGRVARLRVEVAAEVEAVVREEVAAGVVAHREPVEVDHDKI